MLFFSGSYIVDCSNNVVSRCCGLPGPAGQVGDHVSTKTHRLGVVGVAFGIACIIINVTVPACVSTVYVASIKVLNPLTRLPLPCPPIQQCLPVLWVGLAPASATSPFD